MDSDLREDGRISQRSEDPVEPQALREIQLALDPVLETQVEPVATEYDIPADYVQAALAYYREHPEVIDGRLAANIAD